MENAAAISLTNGAYTAALTNTAAFFAPTSIRLLPLAARGDINDDGLEDAAAMIAVKGAARNGLYLLALTSQADGSLQQAGAALVGSGQIAAGLAITDGQIIVDIEQFAATGATCCAVAAEQRTYALHNGRLALGDAKPLLLPALPRIDDALRATRFPMARNAMTGTVAGELDTGSVASYALQSSRAQTATVTLQSAEGAAALGISLKDLPVALLSARTGATAWRGTLADGDALVLDVVALMADGSTTPYTLTVAFEPDSRQ